MIIEHMRLPDFRISRILRMILIAACLLTTAPEICDSAQSSAGDSVEKTYTLRHADSGEVRRMLTELIGNSSEDSGASVHSDGTDVVVIGPEHVQSLAAQLLREIDIPATRSTQQDSAEPEPILATYESDSDQVTQNIRLLKAALSKNSRVSADRTGTRIVVLAPPADHVLATKLLRTTEPDADNQSSSKKYSGAASNPFRQSEQQRDSSETESDTTSGAPRRDNTPWLSMPQDQIGPETRSSLNNTSPSRSVRYTFSHVSAEQAQKSLQRLLGKRLWNLGRNRYSYSAGDSRSITLSFDSVSRSCLMDGPEDLVRQFYTLADNIDASSDQSQQDNIRFVPLNNVDPEVLSRAINLWKQSAGARSSDDAIPADETPGADRRQTPVRPTGFVQDVGNPEIPIVPEDNSDDPAADTDPAERNMRRPSSDVQVDPLPDLDVLILRGRDPDVQELIKIIQEIERLSSETAPAVEIIYLQNVQGEALDRLMTDVLQDLTGPLHGRVSITPLVKPNALLLIGWGEAVEAAKKLIARLDESVQPATQMQMFPLQHASANQVESTVRQFLNGRGGLGPDVTITANQRTNTVIVNAAPRDMQEVARLIGRLDAGTSAAVNQAKIIQLKNALAADVSQTITSAITAASGAGGQRSAALEMLMLGPDGKSVAASGLLNDVRLTPDSRTNRIFITGPGDSLPLVEQLIKSLDESPAASAQIKVFQISNGDATDLVLLLRSLFPEQVPSSVPQLSTAQGETSLAPVRFSVDVRTNSIIATGAAGDLQIIEALLLRLDETDSQRRVNEVYRLKNSRAKDVSNAVNDFLRSERVVAQAAPGRQNPFTQIESEVVIVPEDTSNALIISATPRYFDQIIELVEGLDAQPPQVMIQVILVEIELNNLHEFGVELGLQDSLLFDRSLLGSLIDPGFNFNNKPLGSANNAASLASRGNVGGQALSHFSLNRVNPDVEFGGLVLSASSENVSVLLRALNQSRNVEILSRPEITTLDNQPAFIQVGQRVPQIVGTSINQVGQVNTVEQADVGLILHVTPRISPDGMVVMDVNAEKSELGPDSEGVPISISASGQVIRSPRTNITTAETTVSAASGQTIVIGGLITTSNTTLSRRVPWLSDVPLVGNLFRYDGTSSVRKELLIILTPQVIRGKSEADYLRQIEMARLSWISSDVLSWLSTDACITGDLEGTDIPTIYPDQTPGIPSLDSYPAASPSPDMPPEMSPGIPPESPASSYEDSPDASSGLDITESPESIDDENESTPAAKIRQMSFLTTKDPPAKKESELKKKKRTEPRKSSSAKTSQSRSPSESSSR